MTTNTDLMPPAFTGNEVLSQFSTTTGRPGTPTHASTGNAFTEQSDSRFGTALQLFKENGIVSVRYMGETPITPGCYVRLTVSFYLRTGNSCTARLAGYPVKEDGTELTGVVTTAEEVTLNLNETVTLSAVIGVGQRDGVDMVWGPEAAFGHLGFDLIGSHTATPEVIVDDIIIEDVSGEFAADSRESIDVRDYGAIGDGVTDNTAAFLRADADANGRTVLIPEGEYLLQNSVTFENHAQFQGTVSMGDFATLSLRKDFYYTSYLDAFGDETEALIQAIRALFQNVGHKDLDLCGRVINLSRPLDVQAASLLFNRISNVRRRIFNGTIAMENRRDEAWDSTTITITGTYTTSSSSPRITGISNIDQVEVGSLISGAGIGREVYVKSINIAGQWAELSNPLHGVSGRQDFSLTRYRYLLDFSRFTQLSLFELSDIEFLMESTASGVILATGGLLFRVSNCSFTQVGRRGISSPGSACQGMILEGCNFSQLAGLAQRGIGFNASANDIKVRNNRAQYFHHFGVVGGQNALISGNHFFQGDTNDGSRSAGLVLTHKSPRATISGNYIDNCYIEWTNEHDLDPDAIGFGFSSMSINNNNFLASDVNSSFVFISIAPYGDNFPIRGLTVTGNAFSVFPDTIDRIEQIDRSNGTNNGEYSRIAFADNSYNNVTTPTLNPRSKIHTQGSDQATWAIDFGSNFPFQERPKRIDSVAVTSRITSGSSNVYNMPHLDFGGTATQVRLFWPQAVRGSVAVTGRIDNPDG